MKYSDFEDAKLYEKGETITLAEVYLDGFPVKAECFKQLSTNKPYQVVNKKHYRAGDPTPTKPSSNWGYWKELPS